MYSLMAARRCFSPSADNSVQALGLNRQDETFGERVQIRAPRRQSYRIRAAILQHLPEAARVQRITVHDDISGIAQEAVERIGQIASHLLHPFFARLGRNANDLNFSCLQPHHEKNVVANDPYKCENLDGESSILSPRSSRQSYRIDDVFSVESEVGRCCQEVGII